MRTIALIDMDCFYAQVEQRDAPELWGKPVAVVQYAREGAYGGIIALSYEAKWAGVKRGMFMPEAKAKCPDLQIAFVPQGEHTDKADIQKYREASSEVFSVLNSVDPRIVVERASVDEAFLDMTCYCDEIYQEIEDKDEYLNKLVAEVSTTFPSTHVADGRDVNSSKAEEYSYEKEVNLMEWLNVCCRADPVQFRLAIATLTVEKIRADVRQTTQFFCSAGIGNNKTLAKLVCARHKPRQQSVVPMSAVPAIFEFTPIEDVRMLGGKLGKALQFAFNVTTMHELAVVSFERLLELFPNQAKWLWNLAKGQDDEPVKPRNTQTSIAVGKNFPGKNALTTVSELERWIDGLSKELAKRLASDRAKNKRTAENLVVTFCNPSVQTKTLKLNSYNPRAIYNMTWSFAKNFNKAPPLSPNWEPPILLFSLSASRFSEGVSTESKSILDWVSDSIPLNREVSSEGHDEQPSTSSESRSEERPDEDGWQIYDPAKFDAAAPAGTADGAIIQLGEVQVAKDVYDELPDFIKAELMHDKRLQEAKKRLDEEQKNRASSSKPQQTTKPSSRGRKRATREQPVAPPKKTLDNFFKR